ncbi:MAG: insulinase family protein [Spirochaetales bacterium]|nr:insulinase family protein [Spirochaetales bacterium]
MQINTIFKKIIILLFATTMFMVLSCKVKTQDSANGQPIPLAPEVRTGVLDNGLTYYILPNKKPEDRVSLRLAVNAGSVLEEDDQRGLAHFCEHMAFNGTEHFEKSALVDYLESIGMKFGPEINAYTGFDETVYKLEIPTDDEQIVNNGFQVLEDWSHLVSYDDEEVEKERGVIHEEWRLGRGASGRIRDKLYPELFKGSRYAERLPIGLEDVFMNAPPQRLRDFYKKWYRPDLMAVIVVGDIDPDKAESLIKKHFSYQAPEKPAVRTIYPVKKTTDNSVLFISDPELSYSIVQIYSLTDLPPQKTEGDYREMLLKRMAWLMLNHRLDELSKSDNPPFINASGRSGQLVRTSGSISCGAYTGDDKVEDAFTAMVSELERAKRYGFTEPELKRVRAELLDSIEQYYNEKDNIPSPDLASELIQYYLKDVFMPGLDSEYEMYKKFVPGISLDDINSYASEMLPEDGRTVMIIHPEGSSVPTEDKLLDLMNNASKMDITPYKTDEPDGELVDDTPDSGSVISKKTESGLGAEVWHLSNGADVVIKQTDFMDDEVLFGAFSRGGLSLDSDNDYFTGNYATTILSQSGVGKFSGTQLEKKLAGHDIELMPYINDYYEGLAGSFSPDELDTFMPLLYLYFTQPNFDSATVDNIKQRLLPIIEKRDADPNNVYSDKISEVLTQGDFRSEPPSPEKLNEITASKAEKVYRDRFSGADDFVFVFTGNIDKVKLEKAVLKWIASIPSGPEKEVPLDRGVRPPSGIVYEEVIKGISPQSNNQIYFTKPLSSWSKALQVRIVSACDILETILREKIREDMGGTYNISVSPFIEREPYPSVKIGISFGCDPDRLEELTSVLFKTIESVQAGELDQHYIDSREEQYRRSYETNIKQNNYWLYQLQKIYSFNDEPKILQPEDFDEMVSREGVIDTVKIYFDTSNYISVVLKPEK